MPRICSYMAQMTMACQVMDPKIPCHCVLDGSDTQVHLTCSHTVNMTMACQGVDPTIPCATTIWKDRIPTMCLMSASTWGSRSRLPGGLRAGVRQEEI